MVGTKQECEIRNPQSGQAKSAVQGSMLCWQWSNIPSACPVQRHYLYCLYCRHVDMDHDPIPIFSLFRWPCTLSDKLSTYSSLVHVRKVTSLNPTPWGSLRQSFHSPLEVVSYQNNYYCICPSLPSGVCYTLASSHFCSSLSSFGLLKQKSLHFFSWFLTS